MTTHGDLQIYCVSIEVDSLRAAEEELRMRGLHYTAIPFPVRDEFGSHTCMFISKFSRNVTFGWWLIERKESKDKALDKGSLKSKGLDHFAIGVRDFKKGTALYHSLGLEIIYKPKKEIAGDYSGMKTVALRRGNWVVALVEGVNKERASQVSTYVNAYGDHAIQHAAIQFDNLPLTVGEFDKCGVQFRLRRQKLEGKDDFTHIINEGEDHSRPLLQCFTKPWAYRQCLNDPASHKGGFFFELIQRGESTKKEKTGAQAFDDRTVISLYNSIELEEIENDTKRIFSDKIMQGYGFVEWLQQQKK